MYTPEALSEEEYDPDLFGLEDHTINEPIETPKEDKLDSDFKAMY